MTEQEIRADYRKITEKLIEKEKTICYNTLALKGGNYENKII